MRQFIIATLSTLLLASVSSARHFQIAQETQFAHALLIEEALVGFGTPLQLDDEIAFFDPQGVCAGVAIIDEVGAQTGAFLYGDIPETDFDEGFSDGDQFAIRVWREYWQREARDDYRITFLEGPNRWQDQAFTVISVRGEDPSPDFNISIGSGFHNFGVLDMVVDQPQVWQTTISFHGPHASYPVRDILQSTGDTAAFRVELNPPEVPSDSNCTITVTFPMDDTPAFPFQMSLGIPTGEVLPREVLRLMGFIGFARLIIPRAQLTFGEVAIEPNDAGIPTESRDTLEIRNGGDATLISVASIRFPYRFENGQNRVDSIPPNSTHLVPVIFDPDSVREYNTRGIVLRTNSWLPPYHTTIMLNGRGVDARSVTDSPFQLSTFNFQLHPNPFNSSTTISFSLPSSSSSSLRVYGIDGRLVVELVNGKLSAGEHKVVWDASSLAAGVYLLRLEAGGEVAAKKVVVVK